MSFPDVLQSAVAVDGGIAIEVPETWHQGRTAYGGFSSALAVAAAQRERPGLPPLRSAQFAMIAPLSGRIEARASVVREGRNAIWMDAVIQGEKGTGFTASLVFMRPVQSALEIDDRPVPAEVNAPDEGGTLSSRRGATFLHNHFDVRFALPRSVARKPETCWWVRPKDRKGLDPIVELVLCADALPPGVMPLMTAPVPVSTMHWQVNLLTGAPETRDGWWLLRSTGDFARDGCSSQRMAMWSANGVPVIAGTQSIAVFG